MSAPASTANEPRLYGALCTFRRPRDLEAMLDALAAQTRQLDRLVIIDNADQRDTIDLVNAHRLGSQLQIDIVGRADNPGPAGAYATAQQHFDSVASGDDLLITLDDDDPPGAETLLASLYDLAIEAGDDPRSAGVGMRGGRLNTRTGIVAGRPGDSDRELEHADHLHGNWFPVYRFSALRAVSGYDDSFFWGFEELELGRRLSKAGYRLHVTPALYAAHGEPRERPRRLAPLPPRSWRHYYRHRNLIRILRRERAWAGLALMILGRLVLKPLLLGVRQPRLALWHLRTNAHAVFDGLFAGADRVKHPDYDPS